MIQSPKCKAKPLQHCKHSKYKYNKDIKNQHPRDLAQEAHHRESLDV